MRWKCFRMFEDVVERWKNGNCRLFYNNEKEREKVTFHGFWLLYVKLGVRYFYRFWKLLDFKDYISKSSQSILNIVPFFFFYVIKELKIPQRTFCKYTKLGKVYLET